MHIKSIKIKGFKSHKDVEVELDPGFNVFVGRNGSGKSNFFDAIRFVFGEDVEELRPDATRQSLLHKGATGEAHVNASVEITIDNSDARVPNTEGSDIKLMRMVGLKKDEYFMNNKRSAKAEVTNVLDMAGLSSSNPYYVVAQGKAAKLADMTDEQRLHLLKDVAGTRVYDNRRTESLRILNESQSKCGALIVLMEQMDDRIRNLERESAELAQYSLADRKRKAIEFVLFSAELDRASDALKDLESQSGDRSGLSVTRSEHDRVAAAVVALSKELQGHKADQAVGASEAAAAKKSLPKLQEKRVKLGERVSNLRASIDADLLGAAEAGTELARLLKDVDALRRELLEDEPAFQAAQSVLDTARMDAAVAEQRLNALADKAGRAGRFKTRKERDVFLGEALSQHRGEHTVAQTLLSSHEKDHASHCDKAKKAEAEAAAFDKASGDKNKEATSVSGGVDGLVKARGAAAAAAQAGKTKLDESDKKAADLSTRLDVADRAVFANMPPALRRGLEELAKLSDPSSKSYIKGIHGPLYELIRTTKDMYHLPVEAVAGPELFNVVVEDEQVAAKIVLHLQSQKAGRLTFMPLNRLKPIEQTYPQGAEDCRPLLNFLVFDPAFAKAVKQQFGRVLLCKTSEVAAKYAREGGFIGVTLDGDTANQRGALTGGFIDSGAARMKNVRARADAKAQLEAMAGERASLDAEAASAEAALKVCTGKLTDAEEKGRKLRDDAGRLAQDADRKRREGHAASVKAEQAFREVVRVREQVALLKARIDDLEKEKSSDMKLTAAEQSEMEQLAGLVEDKKRKLGTAAAAFEGQRSHRQELKTKLEDNLLKRVGELRKRQAGGSAADSAANGQDELRQLEDQLRAATDAEQMASSSLAKLQATMAERDAQIAVLQDRLNTDNVQLAVAADALRDGELQDEKTLDKKRTVLKRKEEAANKLRDLGTLPTSELEQFSKVKRKDLVAELGVVHEQLRALQHVNKKSETEYKSFIEQREDLQTRYEELDRGQKTIHDLITSLDEKKDDKILTTFKGVQKHFKEIFSELVPRGSATLVLKTYDDEGDEPVKGKSKGRQADIRLERFAGVGIMASFTDAGETSSVVGLSGGQRTLVALALIFAIQRADPAPFYILDENDAALDPTHRSAVGAMIKKQTQGENPAQFITSTFGEELVDHGDKWFGVSIGADSVSIVEELEKQEAQAFAIHAREADEAVAAGREQNQSKSASAKKARPGEPSPAAQRLRT